MSTKTPTPHELTKTLRQLERDVSRLYQARRYAEARYINLYAQFKEGNILQSGTNPKYFCCVVKVQVYARTSRAQSLEVMYTYRKCDRNGNGMRSSLANQSSSEKQLIKHGYKKVLDSRVAIPETKG